jgi:quaternary ammonium compound-resistance protein SugE
MTPWVALLLAGLMEIVWALGLKYSDGFSRFWPSVGTALAVPLSFLFLAWSLKSVPFGTAYAVWTGIGAAGAVVIGMVLFEERADVMRVGCLILIIAGMIGLKLTASE